MKHLENLSCFNTQHRALRHALASLTASAVSDKLAQCTGYYSE